MKKFLLSLILFLIPITVSANSEEKIDVWVYQDQNSYDYYVINSSIVNETQYRYNRKFYVEVKKVHDDQLISTDRFYFHENDGLLYFSVNDGETQFVHYDGTTPLPANIRDYCLKYLNIDYEISMQ